MATSFQFDNQTVSIPGVYSRIISGQKNPSVALSFGNVLIIDSGSGATWGGGAGIDGTLSKGKDSVYEFDNIEDFKRHAKGDLWWNLGDPLFRPAGLGINGVSKIFKVKANTTIAAEMTFAPDGSDDSNSTGQGGEVVIQVRDEGLIGNGQRVGAVGTNLFKGYGFKMVAGVVDTDKFSLNFYVGTYTGLDQNGVSFDGITAALAAPRLVAKSPEFNNINDLISWMNIDFIFNSYFKLKSSNVNGSGNVSAEDLVDYSFMHLASGGTETYAATTLLDDVLNACADLDISFVFADDFGADAHSDKNIKLQNFCLNINKNKPELYIAAGDTINNFSTSKTTSGQFDNDTVSVVHGGVKKIKKTGVKLYSSMYKAAAFLGREAGLEPQVPLTFKHIDIDGEQHPLNDKEVKQALASGLLVSRLSSSGTFDIVKGINSLQDNTFLVNDNGTTHSKQIKRIARQLNKEIIFNAFNTLFKQPNGVNRNTLTLEDVKAWLIGYLKSKQASPLQDNLIINFTDIVVSRVGDSYSISYKFTPNNEISFLFFTGSIVNV